MGSRVDRYWLFSCFREKHVFAFGVKNVQTYENLLFEQLRIYEIVSPQFIRHISNGEGRRVISVANPVNLMFLLILPAISAVSLASHPPSIRPPPPPHPPRTIPALNEVELGLTRTDFWDIFAKSKFAEK